MAKEIPIGQLAKVIGAEVGQTIRAVKLALFKGVIMDTRVGNPDGWKSPPPPGYVGGRLRGNWQTSTGLPVTKEIDRVDPSGNDTINEAEANIGEYTTDYMTNNLPYAEVWEEKDGMVARNVARIDRNIKERIRESGN
jgi:hypothetical protein